MARTPEVEILVGSGYPENRRLPLPLLRRSYACNASPCIDQYEFRPLITDNTITNTGHSGIAIFADGAEARRNTVQGAGGSGILFAASSIAASRNGIADSNVVIENVGHGIQSDSVAARTESITVTNNICSRNDGSGIYAVRANGWVIRDNTCEDNNQDLVGTGNGITVQSANGMLIENNILRNTTSARTQSYGIGVTGVVYDQTPDVNCLTIRGNTANDHDQSGIAMANAPSTPPQTIDSVIIESNIANDNDRWGIDVALATTCGVSNVTLSGNSASGNGTGNIRDQTTPGCGDPTCAVLPPPLGCEEP